jgi:exodeoxyribonuclease VII small subunit
MKGVALMEQTKGLSYSDAMKELQGIVSEIEQSSVDVDVLAEKVKRAAFLIKYCKEKLRNADVEVKEALKEIEQIEQETQ